MQALQDGAARLIFLVSETDRETAAALILKIDRCGRGELGAELIKIGGQNFKSFMDEMQQLTNGAKKMSQQLEENPCTNRLSCADHPLDQTAAASQAPGVP